MDFQILEVKSGLHIDFGLKALRDAYVEANDEKSFYDYNNIITKSNHFGLSNYKLNVDGKVVLLNIAPEFEITLNQEMKNRVVKVENVQLTGKMSLELNIEGHLPLNFNVISLDELAPAIAKLVGRITYHLKMMAAANYSCYLASTENFQNFQKAQQEIIDKVEIYKLEKAWENHLTNMVEPIHSDYRC